MRANVQAGGYGNEHKPRGKEQHAHPQVEALRNDQQSHVGRGTHEQCVENRADAELLTNGNPQQQNHGADQNGDKAEPETRLGSDALREHVPGGHANGAAHNQRDADSVEEKTNKQLREAAGHETQSNGITGGLSSRRSPGGPLRPRRGEAVGSP